METSRKPKGHKNFYIDLNTPPSSMYTDGDIVSGKCVLFSTHDEDVGSVIISFHGVVKSQAYVSKLGSTTTQVPVSYYNSEDVLLQEKKTLYQGTYTLRKNVLYEWFFQFQLPDSLLPNGLYGPSKHGSGEIVYELEAARARTWQDPNMVERQMDPRNDLKGAPFQPSGLFKKIGSFTGMIATAKLTVVPSRPRRIEPGLSPYMVERQFPAPSQDSRRHSRLSSLLHPHSHADGPICTITMELPHTLIHETPIPAILRLTPKSSSSLPPISLTSIDIHLKAYTHIQDSTKQHHNIHESKAALIDQPKTTISVPINTSLDLGAIFNIHVDPAIPPTFSHDLIQVSYDLFVRITLDVGGKKIKEDFIVENARVISNRTRSSPLSCDYYCTFTPEIRHSASEPSLVIYPGRDREAETEISNAYLALSRLLSASGIPFKPISKINGVPTILLGGRQRLAVSLESNASSNSPLPLPNTGTEQILDSQAQDGKILDRIIDGHHDFAASTSIPDKHNDASSRPCSLAYLWHESNMSAESPVYVRVEISGSPTLLPSAMFLELNTDAIRHTQSPTSTL